MTVICYANGVLAADKRATNNGMARTVTKIRRVRGHLCGGAGDFAMLQEMFAWFERGADPADVPAFQKTSDFVSFLAITPEGRILKYEQSAYPIDFTESGSYVFGSGRDYAAAALYLGKSAKEAVEVASALDTTCGNGVDTLELEDATANWV